MIASQGLMLLMYCARSYTSFTCTARIISLNNLSPSPNLTLLFMWLTRDFNGKPGWSAVLPEPSYASDGVFALLLFVIRPEGSPIMDWNSIAK
jgi:hypothetical protein